MVHRKLLLRQLEMRKVHKCSEKPAIVSRWREYFSDLLNCTAPAREEALALIDQYQEDMANSPTLEEIVAAIKFIKSG